MARGYLFVKYVILVVTVLSAGVAIERFFVVKHWSEPDALVAPDLTYNASIPLPFKKVHPTLDEHYWKCMLQPSKPFCLLSSDKRLELFRSDQPESSPNVEIIERRLENITTNLQESGRHMYSLMADFLNLMESCRVKAVIIEPSVLFCLLPSSKKYSLLSRGFNPGRLQGSRNIITFGVLEQDSTKLNERNVTSALLSAGFKIMKIRKLTKSLNRTYEDEAGSFETVHYFFIRQEMAVHVLVFYKRNSYLWHAGLNPEEIDLEGLLFVDEEIYEKPILEGIPASPMDNSSINKLFIPADIRYFLKEAEPSKFMQCQTAATAISIQKHPFLTTEQLFVRSALALRELKTLLAPRMVIFWLWSRSLLGWSEHCNILHYTPTLELSLKLKSIQGLNLTTVFAESDFLEVLNKTASFPDSDYHLNGRGLHVNITILHEEGDRLWHKGTDEQSEYTVQYPVFSVCSTDIFGQKVNIPCNPDILQLENRQTSNQKRILT